MQRATTAHFYDCTPGSQARVLPSLVLPSLPFASASGCFLVSSDSDDTAQALVLVLCATIFACFVYELAAVKPEWMEVAKGFIPRSDIITDPGMLYTAIGIFGKRSTRHMFLVSNSSLLCLLQRLLEELWGLIPPASATIASHTFVEERSATTRLLGIVGTK